MMFSPLLSFILKSVFFFRYNYIMQYPYQLPDFIVKNFAAMPKTLDSVGENIFSPDFSQGKTPEKSVPKKD